MNATIAKIVNLLFEDLAESEEVLAIRDEIQQNCQERYQDLREAGISEDDAIHAVIESLSGMEEMLSNYPRKNSETEAIPETTKTEEEAAVNNEVEEKICAWSCNTADSPIHGIHMEHMGSADVIVCVSPDQLVHVECSNPELTLMTGMDKGILTIALSELKPEEAKDEIKFSLQEGFDLSSLGKLFEKLAKRVKSNMASANITLAIPASICPELRTGTSSGNVTIESIALEQLRIGTASGDVETDAVDIRSELRIASASGDITVTGAKAQQMQLSSTSGDIEASNCTIQENVKLNTTSGDINCCKQCQTLNVSSISGDITLKVSAENVSFQTVSGDVEITLESNHLLSLNGNTTSGDMDITLPADLPVDLRLKAVSSHVNAHANCVPGAPVVVKLSTISGDMEIR